MAHKLRFSDITKPHLWPVADLTEARKECRSRLNDYRATEASLDKDGQQLADIEHQLALKTRRPH